MSNESHQPHRPGQDQGDRGPAEHQPPPDPDFPGQEPADDLSRREFLHRAAAGGITVAGGVTVAGIPSSRGADAERPRSDGPTSVPVAFRVNGKKHELKLEPRVTR